MADLLAAKADVDRISAVVDQFGWAPSLDEDSYSATVDARELRQELLDAIETEADKLTDVARGAARPRPEENVSDQLVKARDAYVGLTALFALVDRIPERTIREER